MVFFEIISKKLGFSRIGRFPRSKGLKKHLYTPHLLIPLNRTLIKQFTFIEEFNDHNTFIISDAKFLKREFLLEKYRDSGIIFTHKGTIEMFQEILNKKQAIFKEYNLIAIIPFNIPTIAINREFARKEIEHYLDRCKNILSQFPTLNIGLTIKTFSYPELIDLYLSFIQQNEKIRILNLADLFDKFSNYRGILQVISKIKQELDNNLSLMASGRFLPKHYPMLVYLGIDLIDCSHVLYFSSNKSYDTIEYLLPIQKVKYLTCSCIVCRKWLRYLLEEKITSNKINLLCIHNLITAKNYMNKILQYLHYEDFRFFVEKSSLDDLSAISMLKILDKQYQDVINSETPITQRNKIIRTLGPSSYYRPDFQVFRKRIVETFTPEPWTKVIILLPCSAKKPYSESQTHRRFHQVLKRFPDFPKFQEIILTSPLGATPRQLEDIYPVNSYDISVTGEWDDEELTIASNMLVSLLEKFNQDIPIACHLEGGYLKIIKKGEDRIKNDFHFTDIRENKLTAKESLESLESLMNELKDKYSVKTSMEQEYIFYKPWTRKCIKIADYQFGSGSGMKIFPNGIKTWENKTRTTIELLDPTNNEKLGVFRKISGQIELSLNGAKRLMPFSDLRKFIVFNGDKITGTTLFRPGIMEHSKQLFPNDQVIIVDQSKQNVIGVGQMLMGVNHIKNSTTGRVAKINARVK